MDDIKEHMLGLCQRLLGCSTAEALFSEPRREEAASSPATTNQAHSRPVFAGASVSDFSLLRKSTDRFKNFIPNLRFAENDEEELVEEIGLTKRPTIPSLRQRNSQLDMLEQMEQTDEQEKLSELRQRRKGGSVRFNASKKTKPLFVQSKTATSEKDAPFGESLMVMEFGENAPTEAIQWIVEKMRERRVDGGMELIVRKEPLSKDSQSIIFHISASATKLLEIADDMGFMKRTKTGIIRNFNVACLDEFFCDESMSLEDILTHADRQIIVKYALESIRAADDEHRIPGTKIILYHGQSIVQAAQSAELISSLYSLHDKRRLKELRHSWTKPTAPQPIDEIRNYFGESVGMYFSFLGFYTYALAVPTVLGFLQLGLSEETETVPFFCVFYVVWMKVFLELWKRKSSSHAYRWGTITMTNLDEPRVGYYGKLARDPITGKWTPHYPKWKTYAQMYCVTAPIIGLCMAIAGFVTIFQFYVEAHLAEQFGPDAYILYLPSVVNAIYIALSTLAYDRLATLLTDRENHRTQSQYERHRVNKLIVLEFVNNFLCLFYIAFVLQDMRMLKTQLMMQLIVLQFLQNVFENLYPYLKKKVGLKIVRMFVTSKYDKLKEAHDAHEELGILSLPEDDPRVLQTRKETILEEYNTYDDYLELYIQFGYVVLFSSVAPLTAFWALLNNVIEIRLDAYKLCSFFKRPFARRTKNIGAWQLAFETLAIVSILTNCGILYLSPQMRELGAGMSREAYTLTFLIIEHVLLGMTWFIYKAIPDTPHWVRVALAKAEHDSRQALKREE